MAFIDEYKAFKEAHPEKIPQEEQGRFFYEHDNGGANRTELVAAVMDVNGIGKEAARKRVSGCIRIHKDRAGLNSSQRPDVEPATTPKEGTWNCEEFVPVDGFYAIPINKLVPVKEDWNPFGKPDKQQFTLLKESIRESTLLQPIIVWKQENGCCMILGGHTRWEAYKELFAETSDEKYKAINAKVYEQESLTDDEARSIVICSNLAQRGRLGIKSTVRCTATLARLVKKKNAYGSGKDTYTEVSKLTGESRRTVASHIKLAKLTDELLDAYEHMEMSRSVAEAICNLDENLQQRVYNSGYHKKLSPQCVKKLKNASTPDEIDRIFEDMDSLPQSYNYQLHTNTKRPDGFQTIAFHVASDDMKEIRSVLREALEGITTISDETKELALQMLAQQ